MHAPKKFVGQGLSRKPKCRAICFKVNFLCHRSSIWFITVVFKLLQYFIPIRHHPTVCSCGLAARLFDILVSVAQLREVKVYHLIPSDCRDNIPNPFLRENLVYRVYTRLDDNVEVKTL